MSGPTWNKQEFSIINDICDIETLCVHLPWMPEFAEAMEDRRQMVCADSSGNGLFTKSAGFAQGREWRYIGSVPLPIVAAIEEIFPGFFKDKKRRDRFFRENPVFLGVERMY
jgi:hypothetical protein